MRTFLIHGWEDSPDEGWRPWLKTELEQDGHRVIVPAMPDSAHPKMDAWVSHLQQITGKPDRNTFLVGHSLGCITILRYLESLRSGQKIGGAVLVAGFTSSLGFTELESFFTKPIEWDVIKARCERFTAIHSDNDPYVSLHYSEFFKQKLGAKIVVMSEMKHFSADDGCTELPVVYDELMQIIRESSK